MILELPANLLIEFSNVVKTDKQKRDVTLTGRVSRVIDSNTAAVILDGSSVETICIKATACNANDTVTVLLKDHKAYITGNISSPASASSESSYIRVRPDGSIVIGATDVAGNPIGFHVRATGSVYEIRDINGNPIITVTSDSVKIGGSDVITVDNRSHIGLVIKTTISSMSGMINSYGGLTWNILSTETVENKTYYEWERIS